MRSIIRRFRRSHTAAAAYTALVLALGGTAYAAVTITGDDIVDGTIASADIGDLQVKTNDIGEMAVSESRLDYNSVTGLNVRSGSLLGTDIGDASLTGADVWNGTLTGDDIKDGSVTTKDLDVTGLVKSVRESEAEPEMVKEVSAQCPSGLTAISGGGAILGADSISPPPQNKVSLVRSHPTGDSSWTVRAEVIKHPATLDFTLAEDEDGYVTGISSYIKQNHLTYHGEWRLKTWAICV